jgi:hypothetical protein
MSKAGGTGVGGSLVGWMCQHFHQKSLYIEVAGEPGEYEL